MALRTPHGTAKERGNPGPRVEVPPVDEISAGSHEPAHLPPGSMVPGPTGGMLFGPGGPGPKVARLGGLARAARDRIADSLGLRGAWSDPERRPYIERAVARHRDVARHYSELYGLVPPDAALDLESAALMSAAERRAFDAGEIAEASRLGVAARQHRLSARHQAEKAMVARKEEQAPAGLTLRPRGSDG